MGEDIVERSALLERRMWRVMGAGVGADAVGAESSRCEPREGDTETMEIHETGLVVGEVERRGDGGEGEHVVGGGDRSMSDAGAGDE